MTPLRQRMIEKLRIKNYSEKTQEAYVAAVREFARFLSRSPDQARAEDIHAYQVHLKEERHASWSGFNVAMSALRFFYRNVLEREELLPRLRFMRRERALPVVPSAEEVCRLLEAMKDRRMRMALTVAYACGLRTREVLRLQPADIDSQRMLIHVRQGKGKVDRYVTLSPILLKMLRSYWRSEHPKQWLFPRRRNPSLPIHEATIQRACQKGCAAAGLTKQLTPRSLRHAFATHLLEAGTNLRVVQTLLGHRSVRTTQIYTHVSAEAIASVVSPLDLLPRR